jgi:hypothetical protein
MRTNKNKNTTKLISLAMIPVIMMSWLLTASTAFAQSSAPTVGSISPTSGNAAGGYSVTVTGTNFIIGATTAKIGANSCTGVNVTSATSLTCTAPSGSSGAKDVSVTTANGTGYLRNGFTYFYLTPTITSVFPAKGSTGGGTSIVVTGTNFVNGAGIQLDRIAATNVTVVNATTITATTPAHASGLVNVTVVNPDNITATLTSGYEYATTAPTITSISPSSGLTAGGTSVTINGTGFTFPYSRAVTVTNNIASPLFDYQVAMTLDTATLISAGKVRSDCGDIRVKANDQSTDLSYYIEKNTCNTASTKIWTKVPSMPASAATTVYLTYGYPNLTTQSSGTATFELFDDFDGSTLDSTKWDELGAGTAPTISGSNISWSLTSAERYIRTKKSFIVDAPSPQGRIAEMYVNAATGFYPSITEESSATGYMWTRNNTTMNLYNLVSACSAFSPSSGYGSYAVGTGVTGIWSHGWLDTDGTDAVRYSWPGGITTPYAPTAYSVSSYKASFGIVGGCTVNNPSTLSIDWARVRTMASTEPSVSVGSEATYLLPATVYFGQTPAAKITSASPTQIVAISPASTAGTVGIKFVDASTVSSSDTSNDDFTYGTPTITSLGTNSGTVLGGTSVTINGSNFASPSYRLPVTVANGSTGTLTNYQVPIVLNTSTLVSGGKMRSDCGDLRVKSSDLTTDLNYYIDKNTCNTSTTKIWVKVPSIPASSSTVVNVTYGNAGLTSQSNGNTTFDLFDDFDGTTLDSTKWDELGTGTAPVITNSSISWNLTSTLERYIRSKTAFNVNTPNLQGRTSEMYVNYAQGRFATLAEVNGGTGYSLAFYGTSNQMYFSYTSASCSAFYPWNSLNAYTPGNMNGLWSLGWLDTDSADTIKYQWPGGASFPYSYSETRSNVETYNVALGTVGMCTTMNPTAFSVDWIRVRQMAATEPTVTNGAEANVIPSVYFGSTPAQSVTFVNNQQMTAVSPAAISEGSVRVKVVNPDSSESPDTANDDFNYRFYPTVTTIFPSKGSGDGGTSFVITGTYFDSNPTVTIGGSAATNVTRINQTTISGTTPAHATGAVDVTVTNLNGLTATATGAYEYTTGTIPAISSLSPSSGPVTGGNTVTINGSNFSYPYMRAVTVTNGNPMELANYQVSITLDTAALVSAGKMRSDCGDIRIKDYDKATDLNYWIEKNTCNTTTTKVWTKVPIIPASSSLVLYLTYGVPALTSQSSGTNTFDLFDDFDGSSLDSTKWDELGAGSAPTVSGSNIVWNLSSTVERYIRSKTAFNVDSANIAGRTAEMYVNSATGYAPFIGEVNGSGSGYALLLNGSTMSAYYTQSACSAFRPSSTFGSYSAGTLAGVWSIGWYDNFYPTNDSVKYSWPGGAQFPYTAARSDFGDATTYNVALGVVGTCTVTNPSTLSVDWMRVRQMAAAEPTTSVAAESTYTAGSVYFGAIPATEVISFSGSQIVVSAPAGTAGTTDVRFINLPTGTGSTNTANDDYSYGSPSISSVSPNNGTTLGNTTVTINGSNFAQKYYKVPITVTNNVSSALTNYQVPVILNTATLISAVKMRPNCADIRVKDSTLTTDLNFYLEKNTCNSANTKIWVKVPTIPASSTATIYITYGDLTLTSQSNGANTFDLFDDFDGSALDTSKWDQLGTGTAPTFANSSIFWYVTGYLEKYIRSKTSFDVESPSLQGRTSEIYVNSASGQYPFLGEANASNQGYMLGSASTTQMWLHRLYSGCSAFYPSTMTSYTLGNVTGIWSLGWFDVNGATDSIKYSWPGGSSFPYTSTEAIYDATSYNVAFGVVSTSSACNNTANPSLFSVDWARVRQMAATEPSVSNGSESGYPLPSVYFGSTPAQSVTFVSSQQLTAVSPVSATEGSVRIKVVNPDSTESADTANDDFSYQFYPVITSLAAAKGTTAGGSSVVISGNYFDSSPTVTFGGSSATNVTRINSATLSVQTPAHAAGTVDVVVTNANGRSVTSAGAYEYTSTTLPTITSVTPASGPTTGGNAVTINGTNFTYPYSKAVTVTNNLGSALNNYQILMTVDTAALIGAGKMRSDCGDIRIKDSDRTTDLPYYIEKTASTTTCNTANTKIWTKIPSLPPYSAATVYLNYGNSAFTSQSNANNVFDLFDDFDSGTLDTTKWDQLGTGNAPTISGSNIIWSQTTAEKYIRSKTAFNVDSPNLQGRTSEMYVNSATGYYPGIAETNGGSGYLWSLYTTNGMYLWSTVTNCSAFAPSQVVGNYGVGTLTGIWSLGWFDNDTTDTIKYTWPGGTTTVGSDTRHNVSTYNVSLGVVGGCAPQNPSTLSVDWVRVRQMAVTEPSVSIAAESSNPTYSVYFGGTPATQFFSSSNSQIVVLAPAGTAGATDIKFINSAGISSANTVNDDYTYGLPAITSVTPTSGSVAGGTSVTINGSNFGQRFYKVPLTINNNVALALTNYQVPVTLNTALLITAGKMRSDCGDLRVKGSDQLTDLNYYIEKNTCNTSATKVWMKIPTIPPSSVATAYVTYGDPSLTSQSSGTDTFELFDDFEGTSLDTTKWTDIGSGNAATISGSNIAWSQPSSGYERYIRSISSFNVELPNAQGHTTEMWVNSTTGQYPGMAEVSGSTGYSWIADTSNSYMRLMSTTTGCSGFYPYSDFLTIARGEVAGLWSFGWLDTDTTDTLKYSWPGGTSFPYSTTTGSSNVTNYYVNLGTFTNSSTCRLPASTLSVDWVRLRQMVSTEPTVTKTLESSYLAPQVFFGDTPAASVTYTSSTQLTAVSPAAAGEGSVRIKVVNGDGEQTPDTANDDYNYQYYPSISTLTAAKGSTAGGSSVIISGNYFDSTPSVTFGGASATNVTRLNLTTLSVTTPAHAAGSVDVVVTNSNGRSVTLTGGYEYSSSGVPAITSLSVTSGPTAGGNQVTINGTDFTYTYTAPVTFTNNTNTALTNYQASFIINTSALVSASKMRSDCADIRMKDSDQTTDLGFWVEKNTCNTTTTKVWVKLPSLSASGTRTAYITYGDSTLASASNGANVFDVFDDFDGTSLDTSKWDELGTGTAPTVSGSNIVWSETTAAHIIRSKTAYSVETPYTYGRTAEMYVNSSTGSLPALSTVSGTAGYMLANLGTTAIYFYATGSACSPFYGQSYLASYTAGNKTGIWSLSWYDISSDVIKYSWPGGTSFPYTYSETRSDVSTMNVALGVFGRCAPDNPSTLSVDWVRFRQMAETEPSAAVGPENIISKVYFGQTLASQINTASPTQIVVIAPAGTAGTVNVQILGATGVSSSNTSGDDYTYANPSVSSISPLYGTTVGGTTVTINGANFAESYYKLPVTVTNNVASILTNYQVPVTINTSSLVSASKMRSDCADIRVKASDQTTDLSFWVEKPTCNTSATKVWVKVPSIPASSTATIYLTYGNSSLASQSNGFATFDLFDDFDESTVDPNKWEQLGTGSVSISGSNIVWNETTAERYIRSRTAFNVDSPNQQGRTAEMYVNSATGYYPSIAEENAATGYMWSLANSSVYLSNLSSNCSAFSLSSVLINLAVGTGVTGVWSLGWLDTDSTDAVRPAWPGGTTSGLAPSSFNVSNYKVSFGVFGNSAMSCAPGNPSTLSTDWVRVRQMAATEPTVANGTETHTVPSVYFGSTAAQSVTYVNSTQLTAVSPASTDETTNLRIKVVNPDTAESADTANDDFDYLLYPVISTVTPYQGSTGGGTAVLIQGDYFDLNPLVYFDNVLATNITRYDRNTIVATTSAHSAGTVDVKVTNANGQFTTLPGGYQYIAPPTVTSITPTGGPTSGGTSVTINGTGYSDVIYSRPVTVTNSGSISYTNYQVAVTFDGAAAIAAGHMRSDCNDIRVIGTTLQQYSYWLEPNTCNTSTTKIWVKVPSIAANSSTTFNITYHDPANTASLSSSANTFIREITGLAGAWTFDEPSGIAAADTSGNNKTGTATGTTITTGKFGNARTFSSGSGNVVTFTQTATGTTYSLETWLNFPTTANAGHTVIFGGGVLNNAPLAVTANNAGFTVNNNAAIYSCANSLSNISSGWHHVVAVGNSTTAVYIDGSLFCTIPGVVSNYYYVGTIGNYGGGGSSAVGSTIDEPRIYTSKVLSTAEISDLAANYGYTTTNYANKVLVKKYSANITGTATPIAAGTEIPLTNTVVFGETPATNITRIGSTQLTATAPAHFSGKVDVKVTNPYGIESDVLPDVTTDDYAYAGVPVVSTVSPATGDPAGGDSVTITGNSFESGVEVYFGDTVASSVTYVDATTIIATAPSHSTGAVDVKVINTYGSGTKTGGYSYASFPTITSITSVAGDTTAPYVDTTDDSETSIVFSASDTASTVSACKWDITDTAYSSMANTCASTSNCVTNLSGQGTKTVYLRCVNTDGNAMTTSQEVSYDINPVGPGGVTSNVTLWLRADSSSVTQTGNGTSATSWTDLSSNAAVFDRTVSGIGGTDPVWYGSRINNNPAVSFAGTTDRLGKTNFNQWPTGDMYITTVYNRNTGPSFERVFSYSQSGQIDGNYMRVNSDSAMTYAYNNSYLEITGVSAANNLPHISTMRRTGTTVTSVFDGKQTSTTTIAGAVATGGCLVLGEDPDSNCGTFNSSYDFTGDIAETIFLSRYPTATEQQKINSYLAIKYGVPIDQTTNTDYLDSAGNVIWTSDNTYEYGIIGIGRDDLSALDQTSSRYAHPQNIIQVSEADSQNNGDFLIWSHNNADRVWTSTDAPSGYKILTRKWQMQETGDIGTVDVEMDVRDPEWRVPTLLSGSTYYLVYDTDDDGTLTDETPVAMYDNGTNGDDTASDNKWTVRLNPPAAATDGRTEFTLVTPDGTQQYPAGVAANLRLWLRADSNSVTQSGNGTSATAWTGLDPYKYVFDHNTTPAIGGTYPKWYQSRMNGNPAVSFSAGDDRLGISNFNDYPTGNAWITAVFKRDTGASFERLFAYSLPTAPESNYMRIDSNTSMTVMYANSYFSPSGISAGNNLPHISTMRRNGFTISHVFDGRQSGTASNSGAAATGGCLILGVITNSYCSGFNSTNDFAGDIAEYIIYDAYPSATDQQKINSYLAIKYGIPIDQTTNTDYLNSAGSIIWTSDNTFEYDIAGIGQDDTSNLDQTATKYDHPQNILKISEATSQDNGDFLIWARNTGDRVWTATGAPAGYQLLQRQWQSQKTNDIGTVDIEFDTRDPEWRVPVLLSGTSYLFVYDSDNDGSLSDETPVAMKDDGTGGDDTASDNKWTTQVNLPAGSVEFTIATADGTQIYPGGVSANLQVWLRADQGVTNTGTGTNATAWTGKDPYQFVFDHNTTPAIGGAYPVWNANVMNGNPAVSFSGATDRLGISNFNNYPTGNMFITAVFNRNSGPSYERLFAYSLPTSWDNNYMRVDNNTSMTIMYGGSYFSPAAITPANGLPHISTMRRTSWTTTHVFDGNQVGTASNSYAVATGGCLILGTITTGYCSGFSTTNDFAGNMAEFIVYDGYPSATDQQKINSYLALKYGITLYQGAAGGGTSYLDSAGNTVWSTDATDIFENDIAGIGQDDASLLDQVQSKSNSADEILRVADATSQDNGDFLIWSNNNGSATWTSTGAPVNYDILTRKWQAQETVSKDIGTVDVEFDVNDTDFNVPAPVTGTAYYLLYDSDNDEDLSDETPIAMKDDGTGGDDTASDNKWTAQVDFIPSGAPIDNVIDFTVAGGHANPPTVTTVSPNKGTVNGAQSVTITGTYFTDASSVTFDGISAASFNVDNPTQITASTPAHAAGAVDVAVTTGGGTGTLTGGYTYMAAPTVVSISPNNGAPKGGTSVTITGTNFYNGTSNASVTIGGNACTSPAIVSPTEMTCTTPAGLSGARDVVVTTDSGPSTGGTGLFTYDAVAVTKLGNGSEDYQLVSGSPVVMNFNISLTSQSKSAVEFALKAGTNENLTLTWSQNDTTVTIATNTNVTFHNDATATIADLIGNTATDILLIDSALTSTQVRSDATVSLLPQAPEMVIEGMQAITLNIPLSVTAPMINLGPRIYNNTGSLPPITINSVTSVGNVSVNIPVNTTVAAGAGWNEILSPPIVKPNNSVTPTVTPGAVANVLAVYEIGSSTVSMTFDRGVRIKFEGMAGKRVGYQTGAVFTEITSTCSADTQAAGDALSAGGDCKITTGADLVVWTKHFTDYVAYDEDYPPSITDITPAYGPTIGGTSVTITGSNFGTSPGDPLQLTFGGTSASNIDVVDGSTITADTPAHAAGFVDVVVTNPNDLYDTLTNGFEYTVADADLSTFTSDSTYVLSNGTSYATLTATLLDSSSDPVPNKTVTVAKTSGPGTPTITAVTCSGGGTAGVSNSNGQACFRVTSTTNGTDTFTATDTTDNLELTETADVTFTTCETGTDEQCLQLTISGAGALTLDVPGDFSFGSLPSTSNGYSKSDTTYELDVADVVTVSDMRGSGGFNLQLQISASGFNNGSGYYLPMQNFYVVTTGSDTGGTTAYGVEYEGPDTTPQDIVAYQDANVNRTGGALMTASTFTTCGSNLGSGSTFTTAGTPVAVDLMIGGVVTPNGRQGTFKQNVNFHLAVPAAQPAGDYSAVLTYTLIDSTTAPPSQPSVCTP